MLWQVVVEEMERGGDRKYSEHLLMKERMGC